ncbi:MAG: hypothetical protein H5T59_11390, partial [Anaerolineae bacterium]|nr:hypothetical protein [Anaerolineae bacterium]
WRDLLVWKGGNPEGVFHVDQRAWLEAMASRCSLQEAREALRAVMATRAYLAQNVNRRLALEVLLLALPGTG